MLRNTPQDSLAKMIDNNIGQGASLSLETVSSDWREMSNIQRGPLYQVCSGRSDLFLVLSRIPHAQLVACVRKQKVCLTKYPEKIVKLFKESYFIDYENMI